MSDFRLKAFYSVAKNLSFTKASQELFVSQPAVTKHVRELESLYQVRLFDRLGNKISLTEAGRVLLEHCERILQEYRKLEFDMHLLKNEYVGQLRLGASTTIAQYVLPPILARFTEKYPQIEVSLIGIHFFFYGLVDFSIVDGIGHVVTFHCTCNVCFQS